MDLQVETQTPALAPPPPKVYTHRDRIEILRDQKDEFRAQLKAAEHQVDDLTKANVKLAARLRELERRLSDSQREVAWLRKMWVPRRVSEALAEVRK